MWKNVVMIVISDFFFLQIFSQNFGEKKTFKSTLKCFKCVLRWKVSQKAQIVFHNQSFKLVSLHAALLTCRALRGGSRLPPLCDGPQPAAPPPGLPDSPQSSADTAPLSRPAAASPRHGSSPPPWGPNAAGPTPPAPVEDDIISSTQVRDKYTHTNSHTNCRIIFHFTIRSCLWMNSRFLHWIYMKMHSDMDNTHISNQPRCLLTF